MATDDLVQHAMTDDSKALEAAARAIARRNYPSGTDRDIDMMWEGWLVDAQAAVRAYLAQREADGPTAKEVDAVAKVLRDEGCSGDTYRAARHAIRAMIAARPIVER